ncbi:unnamed protein product, partial [Hapterophycus canaliculatus]
CAERRLRGREVVSVAWGLRLWRRQAAKAREAALRKHRIKAWAAAADRRRRLAFLATTFSAWAATRPRVAGIHRLTRRAAARRRRLALAGGFRVLRLAAGRYYRTECGADTVAMVWSGFDRPEGDEHLDEHLVDAEASAAVQEAAAAKAAMEEKDGREYGDVAASVAEESFLPPETSMRLAELTEREGEVFGKLQAETLELRQRATAAEKQEERLKAEVSRKSVQTAAALQTALAEGDRLKAEAEKREFLIAQLDLDARQTAAQAATLSHRLAGADQDLGFEATRNAQRVKERGEGNARLRAAAIAAEKRIAAAENALRKEGRTIEELRSKCAREGLRVSCRGKRRRGGGDGRKGATASPTSGLEFRVFAARADAQFAVERSTIAAAERRSAAGSLLAEALQAVGSEAVVTMTKKAEFDSCSSHGDNGDAARQLVAASVASERREVAGLALRGAEAKMRRSADLSLRARLSHQPRVDAKTLLAEEDNETSAVHTAVSPCSTTRDQTPAMAGDRAYDRAGTRPVNPTLD